ncbi:MAG TPA: arylsulfotransferase family protein [Polyangiaceae bacterium]|nr:arylsulfotransferase family protein [Polyangiaceae bacterium]
MKKNVVLLAVCSSTALYAACGSPAEEGPGDSAGTGGSGAHPASGGSSGSAGKGGSAGLGSGGSGGTSGSGAGGTTGGSAGTSNGGMAGSGVGPGAGRGGAQPMGGTGPQGGTGAGGSAMAGSTAAGSAGTGMAGSGTGGTGSTATCTIESKSVQSTAIPTVHTVTFTTTLTGITKAEIEFGPAAGGITDVAQVDLKAPMYQTYLVGMKPSASYVYRIKLTSSAGTCVGMDQPIMTGALSNAPKVTATIMDAAKHDKGFIIQSSGRNGASAYIVDADGTVVWVAPSSAVPQQPSRVHLSWDAKRFISMSLNVQNSKAGKIQSIAMDGSDAQTVSGATDSHHDFTAIPGGVATFLWNSTGMDAPCSLVEFPDGGAAKVVVADLKAIYSSNSYHTNAIHYYERDDSYTIGDRNPNLYAKLSRAGVLQWQFGGANPVDASKNFTGVTTWSVNHGHHLTADNQFVFFNNGSGQSSATFVYKLDPATMKASQTAKITGTNSMVLGDAQLLPNGNVLITGSTTGTITEATTSGTTVMTLKSPSGQEFGYSEFRESLYGPPPY